LDEISKRNMGFHQLQPEAKSTPDWIFWWYDDSYCETPYISWLRENTFGVSISWELFMGGKYDGKLGSNLPLE
jgi:hypothetical protein